MKQQLTHLKVFRVQPKLLIIICKNETLNKMPVFAHEVSSSVISPKLKSKTVG